jgi:hypothetical protein
VSGATPVLHNDRVNQVTTGHAAPGANVIEFPTLEDIERIERIDRVHKTMAAPTDHAIHVATFGRIVRLGDEGSIGR